MSKITVHADPPRARLNLRGLSVETAQEIHDNAEQLRISPSEYVTRLVKLHASMRVAPSLHAAALNYLSLA